MRRAEIERAISSALHRLGETISLSDSPLVDLPIVQARAAKSRNIFAEGEALDGVLTEAVTRVTMRLDVRGKAGLIRTILEGVLRGKSLASIARDEGKSREHLSRHIGGWRSNW